MKSNPGCILAGLYVLVVLYFVVTQGLFGESFIAIILGMPWTLALAAIEFGGAEGAVAAILLIIPMAINAYLLYLLGGFLGRRFSK